MCGTDPAQKMCPTRSCRLHRAPTRHRELDHTPGTDQGSICPERSRSSSENRWSGRSVNGFVGWTFTSNPRRNTSSSFAGSFVRPFSQQFCAGVWVCPVRRNFVAAWRRRPPAAADRADRAPIRQDAPGFERTFSVFRPPRDLVQGMLCYIFQSIGYAVFIQQ